MIEQKSLEALLADDPLLPMQAAIVEALKTLLPGVSIARHPGKVDVSELIAKSVVNAPGVGVGWSRIRTVALSDGSVSLAAEWVAYIVAEPRPISERRVEKEAIALAIGGRLLQILADAETALQGLDADSAAAQATVARLAELRTEQATLTKALTPAAALADATAAARAKLGSLQAEIARLEAVVHQLEQYRGTLNRMLDMQSAQAIHNDHQAQIAAAVAPFDRALAQFADPES